MKQFAATLLFIVSLTGFTHCKKFIENKKQDALMDIMTDGQWKITYFGDNSVDITTQFDGYTFKYYTDKTVDANKNGTFVKKGTWDGDAETRYTWALFANATEPLSHINGSWHIDDSGLNYVVARMSGTGDDQLMRLEKVP